MSSDLLEKSSEGNASTAAALVCCTTSAERVKAAAVAFPSRLCIMVAALDMAC